MRTFVAFAFKVSTILLDLRLKSRRPPSRSSLRFRSRRWSPRRPFPRPPFPFSTKATTGWFKWQWFFTRNFNFWKTIWILNGQAQNIHSQFFRSEFCSQFSSILAKLLKVGPDFFIFKVSLNFLQRYLFFSLGRLLLLLQVSFPSSAFWSSSQ